MVFFVPNFHKAASIDELQNLVDKKIEEVFGWSDKYKRNPFHLYLFKDWVKSVDSKIRPMAIFSILIKNYLRWS